MRILRSNYVFPSYNKIKEEITQKKAHIYEEKIDRLNHKLESMHKGVDFDSDHDKIKQSIITLSHQDVVNRNNLEKENLKWEKNHRYQFSHHDNFQSLNYFIEDDKEEENNYETFLKFKKKALERDLEEDQPDQMTTEERKRQREEEEDLFKKLYRGAQEKETSHLTKSHSMKVIKNNFQYKTAKVDANNFLKKVDRLAKQKRASKFKQPQIVIRQKQKEKEEIDDQGDKELQAYQKNKKFLTENYMQILKKLEGTNIVKWRILNVNRPN